MTDGTTSKGHGSASQLPLASAYKSTRSVQLDASFGRPRTMHSGPNIWPAQHVRVR